MERVRNYQDDERVERMSRFDGAPRLAAVSDNTHESMNDKIVARLAMRDLLMSSCDRFVSKSWRKDLLRLRCGYRYVVTRNNGEQPRVQHNVDFYDLISAMFFERDNDPDINEILDRSVNHIHFRGPTFRAAFQKRVLQLVRSDQWTVDDVAHPLVPFAEALGMLPSLETVEFRDSTLACVPFVGAILRHCRQVKKVTLLFADKNTEDDFTETRYKLCNYLQGCLDGHPSIEHMTLYWGPLFYVVGGPTMPNLADCRLICGRSYAGTLADAQAMSSLLLNPALDNVSFNRLRFDDLRLVGMVAVALARSRIKHWEFFGVSLPPGSETLLMNAVGRSQLVTLTITEFYTPLLPISHWMEELSLALRQSTTIQTVTLRCFVRFDMDSLNALLRHCEHWTVRDMTIPLHDWNDEIEAAVCRYVRSNAHIWRLCLNFCGGSFEPFESQNLLDAIETCWNLLEEVSVRGREPDPNWSDRLQASIEWNRSFKLAQATIGGHFI